MIVSDSDQYQPRFRIWLKSLGAADGDEVKTYEFQIWASSKAEEFKKINNIGPYMTRKEDHDRFTAWLYSQVTEEIARGGAQNDFNQAV